jgi:hypothetical protein
LCEKGDEITRFDGISLPSTVLKRRRIGCTSVAALKVHKTEKFFSSDFGFCNISLLVIPNIF